MDHRTRRSPARFLPPLALIAVVVVFLSIVSASGQNGGSASTTDSSATTTTPKTTTKKKPAGSKTSTTKAASGGGSSTYTVQINDTLGGIADKTGVPLSRIQELNPNVDPHAMTAGQKIKLK
jgi:LysM repeat protein